MCHGGSSGLVRELRSEAKPGHKHTVGARRAPNVCSCPGFASDQRSRTSPDDPYGTYKRRLGTSAGWSWHRPALGAGLHSRHCLARPRSQDLPRSGSRKGELRRKGAERLKPKSVDFGGRNGLLPPGSPSEKVGGEALHLSLWVFPEAGGHSAFPNRSIC